MKEKMESNVSKILKSQQKTPVRYKYTKRYVNFVNGAEKNFKNRLKKIPIDEFCGDVFDKYIEANMNAMRHIANLEFNDHINVISQIYCLSVGEIESAKLYLERLNEEYDEIEKQFNREEGSK